MLDVLEGRGYLDGWKVTEAGARLAGLYHEADLLVAEALEAGALDGLDPRRAWRPSPRGSAYEARQRAPTPPVFRAEREGRTPPRGDRGAVRGVGRRGAAASTCPVTRGIDAGFASLIYDWASGPRPPPGPRKRARVSGRRGQKAGAGHVRRRLRPQREAADRPAPPGGGGRATGRDGKSCPRRGRAPRPGRGRRLVGGAPSPVERGTIPRAGGQAAP